MIAFCLGVELMSVGTPTHLYLIYTLTFALLSPLGIGIGLGVIELVHDSGIYYPLTGTLQGK